MHPRPFRSLCGQKAFRPERAEPFIIGIVQLFALFRRQLQQRQKHQCPPMFSHHSSLLSPPGARSSRSADGTLVRRSCCHAWYLPARQADTVLPYRKTRAEHLSVFPLDLTIIHTAYFQLRMGSFGTSQCRQRDHRDALGAVGDAGIRRVTWRQGGLPDPGTGRSVFPGADPRAGGADAPDFLQCPAAPALPTGADNCGRCRHFPGRIASSCTVSPGFKGIPHHCTMGKQVAVGGLHDPAGTA